MPIFNDSQKNIRKEIEFYRDKMNEKLINKKPKITDWNKEFWSLTKKLLSITSDFC
ncbi:12797_t:CDS:2 [Gigaspora rosea]|nr:12797_t:CDS:2 [Gigaspora rosea]